MKSLPKVLAAALCTAALSTAQDQKPLRICATTPNAAALVRAVGGDAVDVTVFCKSAQDPHFVRALPSFVRALSDADALVLAGLELEIGWAPALIDQARNPRVRPSSPGYVDLSAAIRPIPPAGNDRSAGDVHPLGNPHYLVDPLSGMAAADLLAAKLSELREEHRTEFTARATQLKAQLGAMLFGEKLAQRFDPQKLGVLLVHDKLGEFLEQQKASAELGGFVARFAAHRGARIVADHDGWPYLLRTCGLTCAGFLEPHPGIAPSTRHLGELVAALKKEPARVLIHVPYFEPRPIRFVSEACGIPEVTLAHQVGALEGTDDYLAFVRHNLTALADALDSTRHADH
ncbi:MAG: metal ABC transporter substrate-binding protein [Planctomycetota bacterium]